jgi:hypothetical protein
MTGGLVVGRLASDTQSSLRERSSSFFLGTSVNKGPRLRLYIATSITSPYRGWPSDG